MLPAAHAARATQVLRFKECEHIAAVKNVLVDQARIERTLLAETDAQAAAIMRDAQFM